MNFKNTQIFNFKGAIRGMRNSLESWGRSDSYFGLIDIYDTDALTDICDAWIEKENEGRRERGVEEYSYDMVNYKKYYDVLDKYEQWLIEQGVLESDVYEQIYNVAFLGPNDLGLAQKLLATGDERAKFMRQIGVSVDITAPIYWWEEANTYKVGTVVNSTNTIHKLTSAPITAEMFECDNGEDLIVDSGQITHGGEWERTYEEYKEDIIDMCEQLRQKYIETQDKRYWHALVQILPQSWLQTCTWTTNYAVLRNMYFQKHNHKLVEWHKFCDWISTLPYAKELIMLGDK